MALYQGLPGVELSVTDGGLTIKEPITATTESILIIAPIGDGSKANEVVDTPYTQEDYQPILVDSIDSFTTYNDKIGDYDVENPIARAWRQAYDAGCKAIYAIPLRGTTLQKKYMFLQEILTVLEDNITIDHLVIKGVYADQEFDVTIKKLAAGLTAGANFAADGTYLLTKGGTAEVPIETVAIIGLPNPPVEDVATAPVIDPDTETIAVNAHGLPIGANLKFTAAGIQNAVLPTGIVEGTTYYIIEDDYEVGSFKISDTADGEAFNFTDDGSGNWKLQKVLSATVNYGDMIVKAGPVYTVIPCKYNDRDLFQVAITPALIGADGSTATLKVAAEIAGFCEVVSAKNTQIVGYMSLTPPLDSTVASIRTYVNGAKAQLYSKYLQVIAGPEVILTMGGKTYDDVWEAAYAGLVSVLPAFSAPTNKAIPGVITAKYALSASQISSLTTKHIVTARVKNSRVIVSDAITTAADGSDFIRLSTLRITRDAIELIREIADPYIGEPNSFEKRNALEARINSGLAGMVKAGALTAFKVEIGATVAEMIKGDMKIFLSIVPVFETRRILIAMALKPSL